MRKVFNLRTLVLFAMVCAMAGLIVGAQAQQSKSGGAAPKVTASEIGGVVTSAKGPEAGVWVVAETTETPTRLIKIVVTDDQGRYLLPDLPKANYDVWVRGYGLTDSTAVQAMPGKQLNLKAVVAPTPADAAKVFPAVYWLSLIKVPDKSEFPIKATPMPPYKGQMAAAVTPVAQREAVANEEAIAVKPIVHQEEWIDVMKQGCQQCHQLGTIFTRDLTHLKQLNFKSSEEAWATRIHFG
jgi:hypothetical protein